MWQPFIGLPFLYEFHTDGQHGLSQTLYRHCLAGILGYLKETEQVTQS
jgi:hypothetical protein